MDPKKPKPAKPAPLAKPIETRSKKHIREDRELAAMKPRATQNPTAVYEPTHNGTFGWGMSYLDGAPFFTWFDIPRMQRDPRVLFLESMWQSPFTQVTWKVKATSQDVAEYVDRQLTKFWNNNLHALLSYYFWFGFGPGGAEFTDRNGKIVLDQVRPIAPLDARPLVFLSGPKVKQMAGLQFGSTQVLAPHAFWFAGKKQLGKFYDRPPGAGMYEPWAEKRMRNGAIAMRRVWFLANSSRGKVGRYPEGMSEATDEFPAGRDNKDLMREVLDVSAANTNFLFPSTVNPGKEGQYLWDIEWQDSFPDRAGYRDYPKDLDAEMAEGVGIPREVLEASQTGSGYSGRMIPMVAWLGSADVMVGLIIQSCEWLKYAVAINYGPQAHFEVEPSSLVEKFVDDNKKGGGAAPPAAGAGVPPPGGHPPPPGWNPYKGPHGGSGFQDPNSGRVRYLSDSRAGEGYFDFDGRPFGDSGSGIPVATRLRVKELLRDFRARELSDGRTQPQPTDPKRRRKQLMVALAMLEFQRRAHAVNDPESSKPYLAELSKILNDPDSLHYPLELSWRADESKSGHVKAIGEAEHAGKVLYGARAEAALRAQEGLRSAGQNQRVPTPHPNHDQWRKAGRRAREILTSFANDSHSPEDLNELQQHLPYLPMDRLGTARSILRGQFKGVRGRLGQVNALMDHIRQVVGVMGQKAAEEPALKHLAGDAETPNSGSPLDHLAAHHGDQDAMLRSSGDLTTHDAIAAAYRGEFGDDIKGAVENGGHWDNHGGNLVKKHASIGKALAALKVNPKAEEKPAAKSPHEMTAEEVGKRFPNPSGDAGSREPWMMPAGHWNAWEAGAFGDKGKPPSQAQKEWHKGQVRDALAKGKPVPSEVIAEYPDLKPDDSAVRGAKPATMDEWKSAVKKVKAAHAQKVWDEVQKRLDAGETVQFNTMTKRVPISPKNRGALRIQNGDIQVARGKHWDSLAGQGLDTLAAGVGITERPELPDMPSEPDSGPGKASHEMTRDEYTSYGSPDERDGLAGVHKNHVEQALKRGDSVPPEVLADYPELSKPEESTDTHTVHEEPHPLKPGKSVFRVKDGNGRNWKGFDTREEAEAEAETQNKPRPTIDHGGDPVPDENIDVPGYGKGALFDRGIFDADKRPSHVQDLHTMASQIRRVVPDVDSREHADPAKYLEGFGHIDKEAKRRLGKQYPDHAGDVFGDIHANHTATVSDIDDAHSDETPEEAAKYIETQKKLSVSEYKNTLGRADKMARLLRDHGHDDLAEVYEKHAKKAVGHATTSLNEFGAKRLATITEEHRKAKEEEAAKEAEEAAAEEALNNTDNQPALVGGQAVPQKNRPEEGRYNADALVNQPTPEATADNPYGFKRTTPKAGHPDRESVAKQYDAITAQMDPISDEINKLRGDMKNMKYGSKKLDAAENKILTLRDKMQAMQKQAEPLGKQKRAAFLEDLAEGDDHGTRLAAMMELRVGGAAANRKMYDELKDVAKKEAEKQGLKGKVAELASLDAVNMVSGYPGMHTLPAAVASSAKMFTKNQERQDALDKLGKMDLSTQSSRRHSDRIMGGYGDAEEILKEAQAEHDENVEAKKSAAKKEAEDRAAGDAQKKEISGYLDSVKSGKPAKADSATMGKVVQHVAGNPQRWHEGADLPKSENLKQMVDVNAKDNSSRFALVRTITDHGYITDAKFMMKAPPEMVEYAKAKGIDKIEGRTPPVKDILEQSEKTSTEPAKLVANRTSDSGEPQVLAQSKDGQTVTMVGQYVSNIMKHYPGAEVFMNPEGAGRPVLFKKDGEIVGLVMPLATSDALGHEFEQFEKGSRLGLPDVAAPGPYQPEDAEEFGDYVVAGRGGDSMRVKVGKKKGDDFHTLESFHGDHLYGHYPSRSAAVEAGRQILAHAHGTDEQGNLIFKPKGEKASGLSGAEKARTGYYTDLRKRAKDVKGKPVKMDVGGTEKEVHPASEHFGVAKSDGGWDVVHRPTGLTIGGWTRKDTAVQHALATQDIPGSKWGEKPTAELVAKAKALREKFENNELPDHVKPDDEEPPPSLDGAENLKPTPFPAGDKDLVDGLKDQHPPESRKDLPVQDVPVDSLRSTQEHIDPDKVKSMQGKDDLPPADVVKDGEGLHHIEDGHHRGAAAHASGDETVPARVWEKGEGGEFKPAEAAANPFRQQHDDLQAKIDRLTGGTAHDKAMASAFPFGTGRPGNASSQRTSKQSDRRIESTIDNALKAQELIKKRNELKSKADQYDSGMIDKNGLPTQKAQDERDRKKKIVQDANDAIAEHMRSTLKPGDTVYMQGTPLGVQRVNPTSITTEGGSKWKYDELVMKHPTEDRAMTPREMVDLAQSKMAAAGDGGESETANKAQKQLENGGWHVEGALSRVAPSFSGRADKRTEHFQAAMKPLVESGDVQKATNADGMTVYAKRGEPLPDGVKAAQPKAAAIDSAPFSHKPNSAEVTTIEKDGKKQKGVTWPFRAQTAKHIAEGTISADELRRRFEEFAADPIGMKEHLSNVLKQSGLRSPEKIKEQAQFMFDRAVSMFAPATSYSYSMEDFRTPGAMDKKKLDATRKSLESLTDDDLHARAADFAEKKAKFDKAMNNPETKDEFEHFIEKKGESALSPEQRAKWDDLQAGSRRAKEQASRESKAVVPGFSPGEAATGEIGIVEGHHQKRNAPTFTVTVQNRLGEERFSDAMQRAKRMGGSYVNAMIAKRYGATPGFQFFNKADAEAFASNLRGESVDRTEQMKQEQADAAANRASSLVGRGGSLEDAAQADLGRDRLTNTHKRAEQAASAESAARSKIATGRTLSAIGEKMAAGDLKHLHKVRSAQDVGTLDSVLRRSMYDRFHEAQKAEPDKRHDWEQFSAQPHGEDDVNAAQYPYPKMWASDLRSAASDLKDEPGLMRLAQKMSKAADTTPKFKTQGNGFKFSGGQILSHDAIKSMVPGLTIPDDKALRVHVSYDWRLAQQGKGSGPFYTANGGKTFGTSPAAAVAHALTGEHQKHVDLVDPAEDKLLSIDSPHEVATLQAVASRLKNRSNPKLKRIGESLSDRLEHYNRLQRADIKTPAELRAALREYLPLKQSADREDPVKKLERGLVGKKIPGFFPTPRTAIDDMLDRADIQPGMTVLEPSAGKGDILDAISERHPDAKSHGIEMNSELSAILKAKGHDAQQRSFLDVPAGENPPDRIVMNPPFEDGQDVDHVRHAYELLKPGGKLVAIMSNGPFFRESKKDAAFREWLDSIGGEHEEMPEGSFAGNDAFRQTGVRTRMVTIDKPGV